MHRQDRFFRVILPAGAISVLATVLLVGYVTEPDRFVRGFEPEQPIHFSHRLHAGDNHIPCLYCHTGATRSRSATVPPLDTCMNCHRVTRTDRPAIKQLAALYESGKPIEWRRIYSLPDHVYFDHRPHVNGGIACQECHGEVQGMERVSQHMSLRMGACLDCHRDPGPALPAGSPIKQGPTNCNACHR
ncbi:MAG: cytochrome c3 family protein [Myxococcaceae bacterium]